MDPAAVPPRAPQVLQVLPCLNQAGLKPWDCGLWDETALPSALRETIRTPERYLQAVHRINKIHRKKVWFRSEAAQSVLMSFLVFLAIVGTVLVIKTFIDTPGLVERICLIVALLGWYYEIFTYRKQLCKRILRLLSKAVGGANALLCEENILIGCQTNAELVFVYVPLGGCRDDLGSGFNAALLKHSCAYAWHLAQGRMPFKWRSDRSGHLQGACCFCQFVRHYQCCWCCCCWC